MSTSTMSIYEALVSGKSTMSASAARISTKKVSIADFAAWRVAEQNAHEAFYNYANARDAAAKNGKDAKVDEALKDAACAALRELLTLIGEVKGHKIVQNDAMLESVVGISQVDRKDLIGEALRLQSVVNNLRTAVKDIHTGMSEEYIRKLNNDYETARIQLTETKKLEGSCELKPTRKDANKFYSELETRLIKIIDEHKAKSWEQLEAEKAELEAKRKERQKENRKAKRAAAKAEAAAK